MINKRVFYIVSTPIGNIDDISYRAVKVLREVDFIACEDTRKTGLLLKSLNITNKLIPLHDHNESTKTEHISNLLDADNNIALVSDAGTPLISDPGYKLVNFLQNKGYKIKAVPGACAAIAALSVSGLPTDRFTFEGFLPSKDAARKNKLESLITEPRTMVFYESPRRIVSTLTAVQDVYGEDRQVVVAREITKTFESVYYGNIASLLEQVENDDNFAKGEIVLIIKGCEVNKLDVPQVAIDAVQILKQDISLSKSVALSAKIFNLRKNKLYEACIK